MLGALISAFATEFLSPSVCFGAYSIWGILVAIQAMFMPQSIEYESDGHVDGSSKSCC